MHVSHWKWQFMLQKKTCLLFYNLYFKSKVILLCLELTGIPLILTRGAETAFVAGDGRRLPDTCDSKAMKHQALCAFVKVKHD